MAKLADRVYSLEQLEDLFKKRRTDGINTLLTSTSVVSFIGVLAIVTNHIAKNGNVTLVGVVDSQGDKHLAYPRERRAEYRGYPIEIRLW